MRKAKRRAGCAYLRSHGESRRSGSLENDLMEALAALGGNPVRAKFAELWRRWAEILGDELAETAKPLGTDKKRLLIGVEDALLLQEIQFRKDEILHKVNAWLGEEYFESVRAGVMLGREARNGETPQEPRQRREDPEPDEAPRARGAFLNQMDPASPVARAYALFIKKNR